MLNLHKKKRKMLSIYLRDMYMSLKNKRTNNKKDKVYKN